MARWPIITCIVVVLCISQPAVAAEKSDQVSLRFGWPNELVLRVERSFERHETRPSGAPPPATRSETRFTWTGTRSGTEYSAIPGITEDPQARKILQVLMSDEALTQRALEDWNRMVQVWHGVDVDVGDVRETGGTTGGAAGVPVENVFTYALEGRVPCAPSDTTRTCVRLLVTQSPRFSDARAAAQTLLGFDFVSALGAPATAKLKLKNTFTTVTHPESLVPVRYIKEKDWSVSWVDSGGTARAVSRTDRWTHVFSKAR